MRLNGNLSSRLKKPVPCLGGEKFNSCEHLQLLSIVTDIKRGILLIYM